jgi:hypothetical protein
MSTGDCAAAACASAKRRARGRRSLTGDEFLMLFERPFRKEESDGNRSTPTKIMLQTPKFKT